MDSGLQLSVLEPVAVEYCNQTVNLNQMHDYCDDYDDREGNNEDDDDDENDDN